MIHQPVSVVSQYSLNAWLKRLASVDQRRMTGNGSALEVRYMLMRYTSPRLLYFTMASWRLYTHCLVRQRLSFSSRYCVDFSYINQARQFFLLIARLSTPYCLSRVCLCVSTTYTRKCCPISMKLGVFIDAIV